METVRAHAPLKATKMSIQTKKKKNPLDQEGDVLASWLGSPFHAV